MKGAALAVLLIAAVAVSAGAQAPASPAGGGPAAPSPEAAAAGVQSIVVDVSKLGVSLSRIQRELRLSEARGLSTLTPFKLEYQVQVYGFAPRYDFIKDFDIGPDAPIPYGAPTHAEFLQQWTPQAYRAPAAPVGALAFWAVGQLAKRSEKAKCEQEIADYRALVMQGIAAPAPRCTQ
jgi:hypothetical protein